jgi:hypothetical protein
LIVALVSSTSAREAEALLTGARETQRWWLRSDCGGSAAMAAQRWGAAMGRSNGREGGGAATAMTAQRRLRRRSDGNGDGGAVMGVAVVVVAVAVAVVHRPPIFACGCSSAAPDPSYLSLYLRSAAPHSLEMPSSLCH